MTGILVLNCGSSSIKAAVFGNSDQPQAKAQIERIGAAPAARIDGADHAVPEGVDGHAALLDWLLPRLTDRPAIAGHRVVHGGTAFAEPARIDATVREGLAALIPLARTHQPHAIAGIDAVARLWPETAQLACFDTAFHRTIPEAGQRFALPAEITRMGVRRYGFHGLSYEWIARRLPEVTDRAEGRVVVAHLGNGASLCGMIARQSRATTMGFTPLDGLVMGTRAGSLDPGILLWLLEERGMATEDLRRMLFSGAGLLGVSGLSNDMRTLLASEAPEAALAVELFIRRVAQAIAATAADLGGIDALVFTGGIGENAVPIRARIAEACAWLGATLDPGANAARETRVSTANSQVEILVIPTNEEAMIARHCRNRGNITG